MPSHGHTLGSLVGLVPYLSLLTQKLGAIKTSETHYTYILAPQFSNKHNHAHKYITPTLTHHTHTQHTHTHHTHTHTHTDTYTQTRTQRYARASQVDQKLEVAIVIDLLVIDYTYWCFLRLTSAIVVWACFLDETNLLILPLINKLHV